jgi:FkbM family methyltransferase
MLIDIATHGILTDGIDHRAVVLDLGANEGDFSRAMIAQFGCTVLAVEPSGEHCQRLQRIEGLRVIQAAVSASDGWAVFHVCANSQSSTIRPLPNESYKRTERIESLTLESLLLQQNIDRIDILKIDIEGAEADLFRSVSDQRLSSIPQISIEFHDYNGMISATETDAIETRLADLGLHRIQLTRTNRENVLFFNPKLCRVSRPREWYCRMVTRNVLGARRMLARRRREKPLLAQA